MSQYRKTCKVHCIYGLPNQLHLNGILTGEKNQQIAYFFKWNKETRLVETCLEALNDITAFYICLIYLFCIGLLFRGFISCNLYVLQQAYITYIRSLPEYASIVLPLHTITHIDSLERVR